MYNPIRTIFIYILYISVIVIQAAIFINSFDFSWDYFIDPVFKFELIINYWLWHLLSIVMLVVASLMILFRR